MVDVTTTPDITDVLAAITSALVGHFQLPALLDRVVETSMRTLHAEVCSIFLEDREREPGVLTMMAGSGFAATLVGRSRYHTGEGFTGTIFKCGRKFNITSRYELEHLEVDGVRVWRGKFDPQQWPSGQSEFRNCIALPLKIKERSLGVIKVENKLLTFAEHFSDQDERFIETIADVVALAIENARLHEQMERQLKAIASKAAHRIVNQITNYDGIELDLKDQTRLPVPDKSKLSALTDRVASTTLHLKRMLEEFKNYGKPLVIEKALSDLNQIVADEIWLAKPPRNVKIHPELDRELQPVRIDSARFAEAIKELLRNAMKATTGHGGGEIYVVTRFLKGFGGNQGNWLLEVSDNGPGFPLKLPLFEPFQSTDPQCTGLGLATVKELVEAHGGTITASERAGGGARITLVVPV